MFGKNAIALPRDYAVAEHLKVTSIFVTLQGEGPYAGQLAAFVRLAGCNLQCSFCDTYFDTGGWMTPAAIFDTIRECHARAGCAMPRLMVITGGEPMMQSNIGQLANYAIGKMRVQIESNGIFNQWLPREAMLVISPKLNEKTGKPIKLHAGALDRAQVLKFVISATRPGYQQVPDWALEWRRKRGFEDRRIYLSPMNEYLRQPKPPLEGGEKEVVSFWTPGLLDKRKNKDNHEYAAKLAMDHDCILTLQQHIYASLP